MSVKLFGIGAPLLIGGLYASGMFSHGGYAREVGRPQAEVMAALSTLDIREAPGSPGTDPSRSGGVASLIRLETAPNEMRWVVMSGDKVATTLIADFAPSDGGRQTKVTAHVERGDAPDDFVAPAFRSNGITTGLFSMVLEDKLDRLTAPIAGSAATCDELTQRFEQSNLAAGADHQATDLSHAIAGTAGTAMRLAAFEQEARRLGCDHGGGFHPASEEMSSDEAHPLSASATGRPSVNFTPGQPMVDPRPAIERSH